MLRLLLVLSAIFLYIGPVLAVEKGGIQYSTPIDYSKINESELSQKAEQTYKLYIQTEDKDFQNKLLYSLVSDYSILGEINKENPLYFARLGIIYGKLGKNRLAKANFYRCCDLNGKYPYGFYSFGNYYFERQNYKKALKYYLKAYNSGYQNNYDNLYQIGIIYEKFGDFKFASKYFKQALVCKDSIELRNRIRLIDDLSGRNPLYDARKRLDIKE